MSQATTTHSHELWKAQTENTDNLALSSEYFGWIQTLNDFIYDELRASHPNKEIIKQLVGISSFIAASNDVVTAHRNTKQLA